jgi:xanthine dehydrogenase small subunit
MRDRVTFLLNGERISIDRIAPTTTLLHWLREHRRLTGSKEGCGEGDCGACTVVVAELVQGNVRYRPLNACIAFVPMLEGKLVLTVESLAGPGGALHPVQQAMVDCHGSQCGFCTPGFVMSLYALYLDERAAPSREAIIDALGGNLCRCTGYGPIIEAAMRMFALPRPAWDIERRDRDRVALAAVTHAETVCIGDGARRMYLPATLDDLCRLAAANPQATIVAGATDVGLWVTKQGRPLPVTIHTGRVADGGFTDMRIDDDGACRIGGGVTHAAAMDATGNGTLRELWRRFAGPQVRASGTVGGNIANGSPIGDLAPALIALGATLHLRHGTARRTLALEDFFLAYGKQDRRPGEVVTGVMFDLPRGDRARLPSPLAGEGSRVGGEQMRAGGEQMPVDGAVDTAHPRPFPRKGGGEMEPNLEVFASSSGGDFAVYKVSKRFDDDISAVCGAFNIAVEGGTVARARIAYGGMAATPKRARALEAALIGRPFTRAAIDQALAALERDFKPIDDIRASAAYRMQVARNLLVRFVIERTMPEVETRLVGATAAFGG